MLLLPASALIGWGGALFVARQGHCLGLVDIPTTRSSHAQPTPKGGGIGLLAAVVLTGLALRLPWHIWASAMVVSAFSIWTDRRDIRPSTRLKVHFLAAFLLLFGQAGWGTGRWSDLLMYVPWAVFIVGTANIYNFMDGINGIAGITGVVAFGLLGTFHAYYQVDGTALWYWSLAAACAGFLPLNLPQARVFMGDVGSILLGFLFASGVVAASHSLQDFLCVVSFLFPFYADELTTMYIRLRMRENLTVAHRRHMYQLLVNELGYAHWKIAMVYGVMQAAIGTISLLLVSRGWSAVAAFLLICSTVFIAAQAYIRKAAWSQAAIKPTGF